MTTETVNPLDDPNSDAAIAYAWFSLAAENGHVEAKSRRSQLLEQLSEEQLSKGNTKHTELVERYGM